MNLFLLTNLFASFTSLGLILILLIYGRQKIHRIWTFCNFVVFIWGIGTVIVSHTTNLVLIHIGWQLALVGGYFISVLYYHTIHIFTAKKDKVCLILSYLFISLAAIFTLFLRNAVIPQLELIFHSIYFPRATVVYSVIYLGWGLIAFVASWDLLQFMKSTTGIKRLQSKYILVAFIIGFIGGGSVLLPSWGIAVYPIGNVGVALYAIIGTYAILKYRLMDIRVFISRAGILLFVYVFVLGIPYFMFFHLRGYLTNFFGENWALFPLTLGIFLGSFGPYIYSRLRKAAENIILADQLRYQKALKELAPTFIFIRDEKELAQKVAFEVKGLVKVSFCGIYLKQDNDFYLVSSKTNRHTTLPSKINFDSEFITSFKGLNEPVLGESLPPINDLNIGLATPLLLNNNLYGFIILGHKEKSQVFTETDTDAFTIIASQVSLALTEIYYFNEFQKATDEKYKLLIEKERLESAFQIAEAYRHEIGNMLNIISMACGNLSFYGDYKPSREEIETGVNSIQASIKKAKRIFNAIREYNSNSKSEFNKVEIDKLLKGKIGEQKESIVESNIDLELHIEDNMRVSANDNLSFAFQYIIEGAIGAINYNKPEKRLMSITLQRDNGRASLIFSDTGKDATNDEIYTGVGIERSKEGGILYFIARRIIFDHKGSLDIASFNNGEGTTFKIELPLIV